MNQKITIAEDGVLVTLSGSIYMAELLAFVRVYLGTLKRGIIVSS